jgi:putative membrane protein
MDYLSIKALHIIFIVTWIAGLFYIVRLFIYHTETLSMKNPERQVLSDQFKIMSKRLWYGITWPSAIITLVLGLALVILQPAWLKQPFMHIKLSFVGLLYAYHFACQYLYINLQKETTFFSSNQLRIWNEVATVILVAVVFLIVLKDQFSWIWGVASLFAFGITLMLSIRLYKRIRERKQ